MKKIIILAIAGLCTVFTGCDKVPSVDTMKSVSTSVGVAAATVANMTKIDDASRNAICEIMNRVRECIPAEGQTFTDCWVPVAKAYVKELKDAGKISAIQATVIEGGVSIACKGIDYVFEKKYPKAKDVKELVDAAANGFIDGFLTVFKPANDNAKVEKAKASMDKDAYDYLVNEFKLNK